MNYYRIFDDNDEIDFFKSNFEYTKIRELMEEYEKTNPVYSNPDFVNFIKKHDPEAELIKVTDIYY